MTEQAVQVNDAVQVNVVNEDERQLAKLPEIVPDYASDTSDEVKVCPYVLLLYSLPVFNYTWLLYAHANETITDVYRKPQTQSETFQLNGTMTYNTLDTISMERGF